MLWLGHMIFSIHFMLGLNSEAELDINLIECGVIEITLWAIEQDNRRYAIAERTFEIRSFSATNSIIFQR